jgi:hypothetical protein
MTGTTIGIKRLNLCTLFLDAIYENMIRIITKKSLANLVFRLLLIKILLDESFIKRYKVFFLVMYKFLPCLEAILLVSVNDIL